MKKTRDILILGMCALALILGGADVRATILKYGNVTCHTGSTTYQINPGQQSWKFVETSQTITNDCVFGNWYLEYGESTDTYCYWKVEKWNWPQDTFCCIESQHADPYTKWECLYPCDSWE